MKDSDEKGFTLIELLIVVVIIGILVAVVGPKIMERPEQARQVKAVIQIQNFESALKLFYLDNGFYPSTEQGLDALVAQPSIGRETSKWREGGYLEKSKVPLDPWRNEYLYISPGIHNKQYDIMCLGRDGEEGGQGYDADVKSWETEIE